MFASFKQIRVKVSLFVLLLLISTVLVSSVFTVRIMNNQVLSEILKRTESLSQSIAVAAGFSSLSQDILGLDTIVFENKNSSPDIEYIAIVGPQGEILVHNDIRKAGQTFVPAGGPVIRGSPGGTLIKEAAGRAGNLYEITSPVVFKNKNLGTVVLGVNKFTLTEAQKRARHTVVVIFVLVLLGGTLSTIFVSSRLTRPVRELSVGVDELKAGQRSRPLRVYSHDELGRLTERFNEMTALITSQREQLNKYAADLEEAYVSTVRVLAAAIDARDNYTLGHSTRVAQISVQIGKEIGLGKTELEDLEIACLFHDVGKIKIPDSILLKTGKLEQAERREMMRHSEYGAEILGKASSLFKYIPAVRHHHEWHDGTGYPDGLSGDKIPLHAAIMSVADVFDAMISDRPYRDAHSIQEAIREMRGLAARQFRPDLLQAFLRSVGKLDHGFGRP